jgi:3-oxoacyl-[acyl-carrier-protein] synthase III
MARIAQIVSTARCLPEHVVTNAELTKRFTALGRPDVINKLAGSTGINQRFYAPKDWVTSDLALAAAKEALKRAGRKPEDIDLVILGTTSPDYIAPNTAVVLQHKLGARNAGTFDVDCACAAFPAQVAIAAGLVATNAAIKTVLVVGVDMIDRLSDPTGLAASCGAMVRALPSLKPATARALLVRPFRPTAPTPSAGA